MTDGINRVFVTVNRWAEGSMSIIVFIASLLLFLIGVNLFVEDTYTSYRGLIEYQEYFNLAAYEWPLTAWAMSLVPQIGQIVFFYVFFSDMKRNWWALIVALVMLLVDFYADLFHRTMGTLTIDTFTEERTMAGAAITLFFFTVGAELFISIGWGIALTTMAPAIKNFRQMISSQRFALGNSQPRRSSGGAPRNMADMISRE